MSSFVPGFTPPDTAARFTTTHWTLVLSSQSGSPQASQALEGLCRSYWPPLYGYIRRRGYSPDEAKDLTQGFFTRLLQRGDLDQVRPELGKFRSYLLASLKHYLANEWDAGQTQKRGGGQVPLAWDDEILERQYQLEAADQATPETAFERRWALSVLEQTLLRLEEECARSGKQAVFEAFKPFLSGDKTVAPQAEIAVKLGMSVSGVRVGVHRLRQRYGQLLREHIAATVTAPTEIEEEIRYFLSVLAGQ
ncbi:MAG: sigma-70 family RNA polymerase sigma factor [Verrucomicrobiota bacterium]